MADEHQPDDGAEAEPPAGEPQADHEHVRMRGALDAIGADLDGIAATIARMS